MPLVTHPKCGKQYPGGSRHGHCGACCRTFSGLEAFEQHRVGPADDRSCEIQPYATPTHPSA